MSPEGPPEYASLGRRSLAALVDNLAWLLFFFWFLGDAVVAIEEESPEAAGLFMFVFLSFWFNYFAFSEWRWGQTIGKNATGIEVTALDGERVGYGAASIRNLLRLVDFFVIGWVMIATGERRQRLGDKAAKTVVVRKAPKEASAPARPEQMPGVAGESWQRRASGGAAGAVAQAPIAPGVPPASRNTGGDPGPDRGSRDFSWVTWGLGDVLGGILAAVLIATVAGAALVAVIDAGSGLDEVSTGANLAAQAALWATLVGVSVGVATKLRFSPLRTAWNRLGFRGLTWPQVGFAAMAQVAYWIALVIVVSILDAAFGFSPEQEEISETLDVDLTTVVIVLLYVSACVIAPLTEEAFFRGFVFGGLRSRYSFWVAALSSGLLFGAVHAGTGVEAIPFLAALGVLFAYLYERTGSIWPAVVAHSLNNILAVSVQVWA
jgi:membrane protease YdiL (CAAX protease family)/uncharacterized RDD family membrane protein YckC